MFSSLLIANRGEIACRIMRTARRMGIRTIAVCSDADSDALHAGMADEAVPIGAAPARESYLSIEKIVAACRQTGAEAVHPGYGFLSENPAFARALEAAGIVFVGPPAAAIETMGDKIAAKKLAAAAGVSIVAGHPDPLADADEAVRVARAIGYPVILKAAAGGGGKGMRVASSAAELREGFARARSEAGSAFGDDRVFIERYVTEPRHIEIQVLGDRHGNLVHLGERECSIQRRHQKVVEEAPSPFVDEAMRAAMGAQAVALARAAGYFSAGTVEFIVDGKGNFHFLEMNTRLQVEHPVTELVTGLDLVELMLRIAAGEKLPFGQNEVTLNGWALEARVYAEDPYRGFLPSTGRLTRYRPPADEATPQSVTRNDTGVSEGGAISPFYDPMIGKLAAWAPSRLAAITAMQLALDEYEIEGIGHNLPFLATLFGQERFREGRLTTGYIAEEFPTGFPGAVLSEATLHRIAAFACCAGYALDGRRFIENGPELMFSPDAERVVVIGERQWRFSIEEAEGAFRLATTDGARVLVETSWTPGETIGRVRVEGEVLRLRIGRCTGGFRIRYRGADLKVMVLPPEIAALLVHMPKRVPTGAGGALASPMPGQLVRLEVGEGDMVEEGQPLAVVEAMKMENVLRADRRARVGKIRVAPGAVLSVDEVIMELESP